MRGDLRRREDTGQINSSPVSAMSPILRLQYGCRHVIRIPGECEYIPNASIVSRYICISVYVLRSNATNR